MVSIIVMFMELHCMSIISFPLYLAAPSHSPVLGKGIIKVPFDTSVLSLAGIFSLFHTINRLFSIKACLSGENIFISFDLSLDFRIKLFVAESFGNSRKKLITKLKYMAIFLLSLFISSSSL